MASQSLFASPRPLSLSTVQALSPAQALAVVDIFINAAIACICHTRELIPWDSACFGTRYIDDLNSDFWKDDIDKYSAFCGTEPSVPSVKSQEFRIIKRGEDKRADSILDLIEGGVFSAVNAGLLEAVRFFVTQGGTECSTADVLESYTLNFSYEQDTANKSNVRIISINDTSPFNTDNAIKSFKKAIQSLLASLQGRPLMPRKRSLGVAMLYNSCCPSTYETPGFLTEDLSIAEKEQSGWHKLLLQQTGKTGQFEVGPYRVVIGASHIRPQVEVPTSSRLRDLCASKQLQSWQKSSSQQRNGISSTLDDRGPHDTPFATRFQPDVCSSFPSSHVVSHNSAKRGSQDGHAGGTAPAAIPTITRKSRKRNVAPQKLAELIVQACALEAKREDDQIFDLEGLQRNKIVRLHASLGHVMRCECGNESKAGDLLLCNLCGTSQHMDCYGWNILPRVKLPDEHFCYSCLLLPREAETAARMPTVVHTRLALVHIQHNSSTNAVDLMNAMHLSNTEEDHRIFNGIVDEIQQDGYLIRHGPTITATMNEDSADEASHKYISPLCQISHHFVALKDGENTRLRTDAIAAAVKEYTRGRAYLPEKGHPDYEQVIAEDIPGNTRLRWGFYSHAEETRKRKATSPHLEGTPPLRKRTALTRKASFHKGSPLVVATPSPNQPKGTSVMQKASRCEALVHLDRSSPSTVFSLDEVQVEAVNVAISDVQWEEFRNNG